MLNGFVRLKAAFIALLLGFLPAISDACPVCGFGQDQSQGAYILTAGILTFLPLLLAAGIAFVVWKKVKSLDNSDQD